METSITQKVKKVLLIDDDKSCNFILGEFIRLVDKDVAKHECYSVDEAFEFLDTCEQFPEVIFLDLNMPVKSGFEFLEVYSNRYFNKVSNSKVVVLTSSLRPSDKSQTTAFKCVSAFKSKSDIDLFIGDIILGKV